MRHHVCVMIGGRHMEELHAKEEMAAIVRYSATWIQPMQRVGLCNQVTCFACIGIPLQYGEPGAWV